MMNGDLEALSSLRREPVVVHLGVQQDAQAVLLTQLDSGPETYEVMIQLFTHHSHNTLGTLNFLMVKKCIENVVFSALCT